MAWQNLQEDVAALFVVTIGGADMHGPTATIPLRRGMWLATSCVDISHKGATYLDPTQRRRREAGRARAYQAAKYAAMSATERAELGRIKRARKDPTKVAAAQRKYDASNRAALQAKQRARRALQRQRALDCNGLDGALQLAGELHTHQAASR